MSSSVMILNGPNLGRLGTRQPEIYGKLDYATLVERCEAEANRLGLALEVRQTDRESDLLTWLEEANRAGVAVILNAGAFTHYSVELSATCSRLQVPLIEVHISNPHAREPFRSRSVISRHADGVICGFGLDSYLFALQAVAGLLDRRSR